MAKNRMIRPQMWTDDKFVVLSPLARLLFVGMWNYACDNGHLDDSVLQLKMRVLPADGCDTAALLEEVIQTGMVVRDAGYLKVVNLTALQPLDLRFLVFCDHCDEDPNAHYSREDKKGSRAPHTNGTRAPRESPSSSRRSVDGDGDGDVESKSATATRGSLELNKRRPETPLPEDWRPTPKHRSFAATKGLSLDDQVFRFRNHAQANDRRQRDWDATFNTWLSRALDYAPAAHRKPNDQRPEGW